MGNTRKPRRGPAGRNVLVTGDTGPRQPQHGAKPGATESGDLQAREFGVPQADLPGGVKHLVNPETVPVRNPKKDERPDDYHKYHGVPSDDGQYYPPPYDVTKQPKPQRLPKWQDAVPVYTVEGPDKERKIRRFIGDGPVTLGANTVDPVRIADRDPYRFKFWISNEAASGAAPTTNGVRIGEWEVTADGRGMLIPGSVLRDFNTQDSLYVINPTGSPIAISWGYETYVPAEGLTPVPE